MKDILSSYEFNVGDNVQLLRHPFIISIGHETRYIENGYEWECKFNNECVCIFQYTISGEGIVEVNKKPFIQGAGSFFMIERPGPYKYYISESSNFWEIIYVGLSFSCMPFWNSITSSLNRISNLEKNGEVYKFIEELFERARTSQLENLYDNSMFAYMFLIKLHKYLREKGTLCDDSVSIELCIEFMNSNYNKDITILDIANFGNISPFSFGKKFKDIVGDTPIHYLTKQRVKQSMILLCNTDLNIHSIAAQCGFEDANYFTKVFRKFTNFTPLEFRKKKSQPIIL